MATTTSAAARRHGGQPQPVLGGAQADHDQHHLGPLEEDALEGHGKADTVVMPGAPQWDPRPNSATVSA